MSSGKAKFIVTPVQTMQAIYGHIRQGQWDETDKFLSDDFVAYEPESLPFGGQWTGKGVYQRLFRKVMGTFDSPQVEPIDMSGGDEWVSYCLNLSFISKASGERVTYRVVENGRVIDGKMTELHLHYFDTAGILKDLGASS